MFFDDELHYEDGYFDLQEELKDLAYLEDLESLEEAELQDELYEIYSSKDGTAPHDNLTTTLEDYKFRMKFNGG